MSGTVAVCCGERARSALFNVGLEALEKPAGTVVRWHVGGHIPTNRASAVREMVGGWLFFVDDDVLVRPDTLTRLLDCEVPVVSAAVVNRHDIAHLTAQTLGGGNVRPGGRGLERVGFVSTSALLIRREALEGVNTLFRFDHSVLDETGVTQGEDVWFCRQLRDAGVPIYLDHDVPVGHLAEAIVEPGAGRARVFVGGEVRS